MENLSIERKQQVERIKKGVHKPYWIGKRLFDICASLFALIVLAVPMAIIALLVYLDDPHACAIFSQMRVGRNGKEFKMYKFRTMVANAPELLAKLKAENEKDGPVFKIKDDPRITKIGHFLRKTSIDELPQLINILKGDMSVVGPRPPLPNEVEQYSEYHKLRMLVTPGLTCIWQVQPDRDSISFEQWMDMDVEYVEKRSWGLDLKLILLTVRSVFCGDGE